MKTSPQLSKFHIVFSEQQGGEKLIIKTKYYMLDLDSQMNCAIKHCSLSDALTICRLDASFNEYNIVEPTPYDFTLSSVPALSPILLMSLEFNHPCILSSKMSIICSMADIILLIMSDVMLFSVILVEVAGRL